MRLGIHVLIWLIIGRQVLVVNFAFKILWRNYSRADLLGRLEVLEGEQLVGFGLALTIGRRVGGRDAFDRVVGVDGQDNFLRVAEEQLGLGLVATFLSYAHQHGELGFKVHFLHVSDGLQSRASLLLRRLVDLTADLFVAAWVLLTRRPTRVLAWLLDLARTL